MTCGGKRNVEPTRLKYEEGQTIKSHQATGKSDLHTTLLDQNARLHVGHDVITVGHIGGTTLRILFELEVVFHEETTEDSLDGVGGVETTGASLAAVAEVHVRAANGNQVVGALGVFAPAPGVEVIGVLDDLGITGHGTGGEANVGAFGEHEAVRENELFKADALSGNWSGCQ